MKMLVKPEPLRKSKFLVRRMSSEDLDRVFALELRIFATPWTRKSYEFELHENSASEQWVIEAQTEGDEHEVAAYSVCWVLGEELHIANFAVAAEFRRRGLGRQLLAHLLDRAAAQGLHSATLEVRAGNLAAQNLYKEFGFIEIARRERYYSDNREDAILMRLPRLGAI